MVDKKLKIGIFSLTSCEGCGFAILDATARFLALNERAEITRFRLFEESTLLPQEQYDVVFVEGSPLTAENKAELKHLRKNSRILIALGSCAVMGGIYHLKQYQDKEKIFNQIYFNEKGIENFSVKPLSELVKVDYVLPGCPITAKEFFQFVYQLILGKKPQMTQRPVCYECQVRGYDCALQQEKICFGPITLGGCEAVCLKSGQGCWGCRGLVEDAEVDNLVKQLREKHSDKEIIKALEVFGLKEQINL